MTLSTKTAVRIASFTIAAFLLLVGVVIANTVRANSYRRQMENNYLRAVQELSSQLSAVSSQIQKIQYAGTSAQIAAISTEVWRDAGYAKAAFGNLPGGEQTLDSTYRFLSQVGDYAGYIARRASQGQEIGEEERESLLRLAEQAEELRDRVARMERVLSSGAVELDSYLRTQLAAAEEELGGAVAVSAGLDGEEELGGLPALIYDGPFSDHILQKTPAVTKDKPEISRTQARETAARFAGLDTIQLEEGADEDSSMPSYTFRGRTVDIGVTKHGGYVTYLLDSRTIGAQSCSIDEARAKAADYLQEMGIRQMRETYYELAGGILTVNYAYTTRGITCYTDLIKVGVAVDNGAVVFYDARGFLSNHSERRFSRPRLDEIQAAQSLSSQLEQGEPRLALIPSRGRLEVLTYEFPCKGLKGEDVLVYVNADTGAEEQILILLQNENGTLAI